jgi:hypothetical protein
VFGYDANPTFVDRAENVPPNEYEQLVRKADLALRALFLRAERIVTRHSVVGHIFGGWTIPPVKPMKMDPSPTGGDSPISCNRRNDIRASKRRARRSASRATRPRTLDAQSTSIRVNDS